MAYRSWLSLHLSPSLLNDGVSLVSTEHPSGAIDAIAEAISSGEIKKTRH